MLFPENEQYFLIYLKNKKIQSCIGEVEAQTHMLLKELCHISHQYPGRSFNNLFMYLHEIKRLLYIFWDFVKVLVYIPDL